MVYGLTRGAHPDIELVLDQPGPLATALARGSLDAALIPSIEYLRGVGGYYLDGPAVVANPSFGTITLLTTKPIDQVNRIAVGEFCRSPLAVLRITLAEIHGVMPDLCVEKNPGADWPERYDGILLGADAALAQSYAPDWPDCEIHNIVALWNQLTSLPLVQSLWVYHDESLTPALSKAIITSRNLGVQNLNRLADGIAQTSEYETDLLVDYFSRSFEYQLSPSAADGLYKLEEFAMKYDLIRQGRLATLTR